MSNLGEPRLLLLPEITTDDPNVPLKNLSALSTRMDSLQQFLSVSVNTNTLLSQRQMNMVSSEIISAIHQVIVNGAALLASSQKPTPLQLPSSSSSALSINNKHPETGSVSGRTDYESDCEVVEIDAVELLAENIHFCQICGKGFKRDANLRMHMRAHGNEFKTPEALAKPADKAAAEAANESGGGKRRFSCPYEGCNRNKKHKKFRALKSVACVKNHFKRSHCPKTYGCDKCHKKKFSVASDLKSHYKNCGESRWKCSCGTSFSRKDKLFGHVASFEGHMPEVFHEEEEEEKEKTKADDDDEMDDDELLFEGLLDGFASIDNFCLEDVLGSCNGGGGVL